MDEKVHHLKKDIAELQKQVEFYKNKCKEQAASDDTML